MRSTRRASQRVTSAPTALLKTKRSEARTLKGLPLEGLARVQFLEAILRVPTAAWRLETWQVFVTCASLETFSPLRSLRRWMKATGLGHQMGHRRALHATWHMAKALETKTGGGLYGGLLPVLATAQEDAAGASKSRRA